MALFVPAGRFNCKLRWRLFGDPEEMISTLGVEPQGTPSPTPTPTEIAHAVWAAWLVAWPAGSLHSGWSFVGVDVQAGSDITEEPGDVASWDEIVAGTHAYTSVTSNCSLLVKKKTPFRGRHNSGRMFLPAGYVENDAVGQTGIIIGSSLATYQTNMNAFYDALTGASVGTDPVIPTDLQPLLFHNTQPAPEPEPIGLSPTPITSFVVDGVLATQRRRMRH